VITALQGLLCLSQVWSSLLCLPRILNKHSLANTHNDVYFSVKYYNSVTHLCMVRCGTEEYRQVQQTTMIASTFHAHPTHVIGPTPLTWLQPHKKLHNVTLALCILQVWCALSMINEISSKRAMLHFLHLGGRLWLAIIACQSCSVSRLSKLSMVEDS
jgi:hypothetical protein